MKPIIEGNSYYVWRYNDDVNKEVLGSAELCTCDNCGKLAAINFAWVMNSTQFPINMAIKEASEIKAKHPVIEDLLGTEDGEARCETCYYKKV